MITQYATLSPEAIKQAVTSTKTCKPETLKALLLILNPSDPPSKPAAVQQNQSRAQAPDSVASKSTRSHVASKNRVPAAKIKAQDDKPPALEPLERLRLATEVVNLTLKALTTTIKVRSSPRTRDARKSTNRPGALTVGAGSCIAQPPTPLQPRSINRRSASPSKPVKDVQPFSAEDGNILALAGCARAALASLRKHTASKENKERIPPFQVEAGMSALIAKLLALDMLDSASKELHVLAKRLDMGLHIDNGSEVKARSETSTHTGQSAGPSLIDLLHVSKIPKHTQQLSLVITTQLQILRLLALKPRFFDGERLINRLTFKTSDSPANLISLSITSAAQEQGAQQLGSLARVLLDLSRRHKRQDNPSIKNRCCGSGCCFRLQALSLQTSWRGWILSGHQIDLTKEVVGPLTIYTNAFFEDTSINAQSKVRVADAIMNETVEMISATRSLKAIEQKELDLLRLILLQNLLETKTDTERLPEHSGKSFQWVQHSIQIIERIDISQAKQCSVRCRMAVAMLRKPFPQQREAEVELLRQAVKALSSSVDGSSDELDEMLAAVSSLRKSAMLIILEDQKPPPEALTPDSEYNTLLRQAVLFCLNFVVRYLGRDPGKDQGLARSRFQKRLELALKVAGPTIDNILMLAKMSVDVDYEVWKPFDQALQDCVRLAEKTALDRATESLDSSSRISSNIHASISNIFWRRYLALKQQNRDSHALKPVLRKSISLLVSRDVREQSAGMITAKIERLGILYELSGEWDAVLDLYTQALKFFSNSGTLQLAAQSSSRQHSMLAVFENEDFKVLSRILDGYSRSAIHVGRIDLNHLSPDIEVRGFLLETQLYFTSKLLGNRKTRGLSSTTVKSLADNILDIYSSTKYPLRRLRCLCLLLECSLNDEILKGCTFWHESIPDSFISLGEDEGLFNLQEHFKASFGVLKTLQGTSQDFAAINVSLDVWKKLITEDSKQNRESLQNKLGDLEVLLRFFDTVANFCHLQALDSERATVLYLSHKTLEISSLFDDSIYLQYVSALAIQLVQLGFTHEAGSLLQKGKPYVESASLNPSDCLQWHAASAEYFLAMGCAGRYLENTPSIERILRTMVASEKASSLRDPKDLLLIAEALRTLSSVDLVIGNRSKALYYLRRASSMMSRGWALLEREARNFSMGSSDRDQSDTELDQSMCKRIKGSGQEDSIKQLPLPSSRFWQHVTPLLNGLLKLAKFLAEEGLFLEAQHYIDQADKISRNVGSMRLRAAVDIAKGEIAIRSGQAEHGLQLLKGVEKLLQADYSSSSREIVLLRAKVAAAYTPETCLQAFGAIEKTARTLRQANLASLFPINEDAMVTGQLIDRLKVLSLTDVPSEGARKVKLTKSKTKQQKPTELQSTLDGNAHAPHDNVLLQQLRCELLRLSASSYLQKGKLKQAITLLDEAETLPRNTEVAVVMGTCKAQLLFLQALGSLDLDPVFSILSESTVACPSVISLKQIGPETTGNGEFPLKTPQPKKRAKAAAPPKTPSRGQAENASKSHDCFGSALEEIRPLPVLAESASSTATVHSLSDHMVKVLMAASAMSSGHSGTHVGPTKLAFVMEFGRSVATIREQSVVAVEKQLGLGSGLWDTCFEIMDFSYYTPKLDLNNFQADYIDIIPENWTVLSLSVSGKSDELRLCKLKARASPFAVCIPLNKKGANQFEADAFGFHEAKAELKRIIDLANFSTHDAGDLSRKGAKTAWWEARAELDSRLKDLLINIENIWLGGFRGVIKHSVFQKNLMSKFQFSFLKTLDKHLPSRSRTKTSKADRVMLDPRVLELFVALGNPTDLEDIDEPILDLLYFVVDILQFNGERNAYDEIDFDPMVIEVQDALVKYHEVAKGDEGEQRDGHIILILDKKLHSFPWESLPCLAGQSISRLPSLQCLRDRILKLRQQDNGATASSFNVDPTDGAYVLNPSGDLQHTQSTFETPLSALHEWPAVINQAPTESVLADTLASKSLYLYFGHGSGGQYIRSRTIRKLDQCAVSLLMGCSSGLLTEAGEYESYGTPINYLNGGAPAVVGTLWDVTDKDIDRFSMKVLRKWGLFQTVEEKPGSAKTSRSVSPVKRGTKGKGRQRSKTREQERWEEEPKAEKISLDAAVAQSRDACILRYLNGAAPVVYGIPVSLS